MCWFFVCFKIDPFLSESRAQNFFDLGHFIEEFIRVPLSNSPGNYLKKSLLADTETSMRKCIFMFFFLYPPSFLQKKPSEKWCFSKTVNIPCKGWQKNCSASRVGTTVFHLQKGSHVAVKSPSWPWGFSDGEVDSDKENANSQRHCRRCRNAAVFFFFFGRCVGFIWFYPFLAGNW